jgi:hypothetical protein
MAMSQPSRVTEVANLMDAVWSRAPRRYLHHSVYTKCQPPPICLHGSITYIASQQKVRPSNKKAAETAA